MENQQTLKKRLYQNLLTKPNKPTYLLDTQSKNNLNNSNSKLSSSLQSLKPKIIQQSTHLVLTSSPQANLKAPILPKHSSKSKLNANNQKEIVFDQGKILLSPKNSQHKDPFRALNSQTPLINKKTAKPEEVEKSKLSKQGKAVIEQGKIRAKDNLKPHDIFMFYDSFPQMKQDFFYLNKNSHPYDYQVIPYAQRHQGSYMTISSQGVTLYHNKEVEFVTKDQWIKDQKMYHKLQKISFFQQYKISKNFLIWKNKMKRHYMKEMSNVLEERLFLTYNYPRKCLLQIKKLTNSIKDSLYFLPTDSMEPLTHEKFLSESSKFQQKTFIQTLNNIEEKIVQSLQHAIDEEINKFKLQNNIKIDGLDTSAQLASSKVQRTVKQALHKNKKSDQNNKQEQNSQKKQIKEASKEVTRIYSQEAILRKQYKRVAKLIKLVDNNIIQSKIQLVKRCLQQLLEKLQEIHKQQIREQWIICKANPIIQEAKYIQVSDFQNNQIDVSTKNKIQWQPSLNQLKQTIQTVIQNAVRDLGANTNRIIQRQVFQKYKAAQDVQIKKQEKYHSLKNLVQQSEYYPSLIEQILEIVEQQFKRTQKEEKELIKYINIYRKHLSYNMKEIFATHTVSQISQLVREWRQDNQKIELLPQQKNGGLLVFDYSILRKKIINAPKQSLNTFTSILPGQVSRRCSQISSKVKSLLQSINTYPTDIFSFAQFNSNVKIASDVLQQTAINQGKQLSQMIILMEENKVSSNIDIFKGRVKQAINSINQLKVKVEESNAKFDHSLSKLKKDLEITIQKIKNNVKDLKNKFQNIQIQEIGNGILTPQNQQNLIKKLKQFVPSIEYIQKQSQQISKIQDQLNLSITDFTYVNQLYRKSQLVFALWKCKREWGYLLRQISRNHFTEIKCMQTQIEWQKFNQKSNKLLKQLTAMQGQQNQIAKKLFLQIVQFQSLLQCIQALQNPNLDQKGWKQITQYLAFELNQSETQNPSDLPFADIKDPKYTVEWFIEKNIPLYKQKFQFIVKKSQKQKQLTVVLTDIKAFLHGFSLETVLAKRQVILMADNDQLLEILKENLTKLQSILLINGNQYSLSIRKEAETLLKQYQYLEQILYAFQQFRINWQTYESFFQPNTHSLKVLTKQGKQFSSWQIQWKKLAKQIIADNFHKKIVDQTLGLNPSRAFIKQINKINLVFDQIKKGFDQYLQKKRNSFSKYYFYTDQQLLKILNLINDQNTDIPLQSSIPQNTNESNKLNSDQNNQVSTGSTMIQLIPKALISKLYDNISEIQYDRQSIFGFKSKDNQIISMKPIPFKIQSQVQQNLKSFDQHIKKTLNTNIRSALLSYTQQQTTREQMILNNTTQIVLAVDHISWVRLAQETYLCHQPIGDLYDWLQIQNNQIKQLHKMLQSNDFSLKIQMNQNLKSKLKINNQKIQQLISQSIYFREKTETLIKSGIVSSSSYEWERTTKLYLAMNHTYGSTQIYLKQISPYKIFYCYQFLGNNLISFITPQRQRCWMKINQALSSRESLGFKQQSHLMETLNQLSYLIAQRIKSYHIPLTLNIKSFERLIAGVFMNGYWSIINTNQNCQAIQFLAIQLNQIKNVLLQSQIGPYQTSIGKFNININPNTAVFIKEKNQAKTLNDIPSLTYQNNKIIDRSFFRNISLQKPDNEKILKIIAKCRDQSQQIATKITKGLQLIQQSINGQSNSIHCGNNLNFKYYQKFNTLKIARIILEEFLNNYSHQKLSQRSEEKQKSVNLTVPQNHKKLEFNKRQSSHLNLNSNKHKKSAILKLPEVVFEKPDNKIDERVIESLRNTLQPLILPQHRTLFSNILQMLNPFFSDKGTKIGTVNSQTHNQQSTKKMLKSSKKIIPSLHQLSGYSHIEQKTLDLIDQYIAINELKWLDNDMFKFNAALLYELVTNKKNTQTSLRLQCQKAIEDNQNSHKGIIVCGQILCGKTQLINFVINLCERESQQQQPLHSFAPQHGQLYRIKQKEEDVCQSDNKRNTILRHNSKKLQSKKITKKQSHAQENQNKNQPSIKKIEATRKKTLKMKSYAKNSLIQNSSSHSILKTDSDQDTSGLSKTQKLNKSKIMTENSRVQQQNQQQIKITPWQQKNKFRIYHNAYDYQDIYGNQLNMKTVYSTLNCLNYPNGRIGNGNINATHGIISNKAMQQFQRNSSILISQQRNIYENNGMSMGIQSTQNQNNGSNNNNGNIHDKPQPYLQGILSKNLKENNISSQSEYNQSSLYNWIIFDGSISKNYSNIFSREYQNLVLSNSSLLGYNSQQTKTKVILETTKLSQIQPSLIMNNHIIYIKNQSCTIDSIISSYAQKQVFKNSNLSSQSIKYLFSQLKYGIKKLGSYTNNISSPFPYQTYVLKNNNQQQTKNKGVQFIYPISHFDLTHKVLKFVEAIFIINGANIKEKQTNLNLTSTCSGIQNNSNFNSKKGFKNNHQPEINNASNGINLNVINPNMKKIIEKFVVWSLVWSLDWLVNTQFSSSQNKFQKIILQIFKNYQNSISNFNGESIKKFIIGWNTNNGLQLQYIGHGRIPLTNIPQEGMLTTVLNKQKNIMNYIQNGALGQMSNRSSQQICLEQPYSIRVNTEQSAKYSYFYQIHSAVNRPIMIIGKSGTGKKALVQLYAKNNQNNTDLFSIRLPKRYPNNSHNGANFLSQKLQNAHFFRKFNSINSNSLKPLQSAHKVVVMIQDISMESSSTSQLQFIRMFINESGMFLPSYHKNYYNPYSSNSNHATISSQNNSQNNGYLNYNKSYQWMNFSSCDMCFISNNITSSDNSDVSNRFLSRVNIFQVENNNKQKINSIFAPIIKEWAFSNGITETSSSELAKLFNLADDFPKNRNSLNNDNILQNSSTSSQSLLGATINICQSLSYLVNNNNQIDNSSILNKILITPNLCDFNKIISNVLRVVEPVSRSLSFYAELWVHQVLRVFADRMKAQSQNLQSFIKEIRKQALLKFKQNISYSLSQDTFIFTTLSIPQETYQKIQDPQTELYTFINTLLESNQLCLPLFTLFPQLMSQILRIHRILEIDEGHLMLFGVGRKIRNYLIELGCQIASNKYHNLTQNHRKIRNNQSLDRQDRQKTQMLIDLEKHILPAILNEYLACLHIDIEMLSYSDHKDDIDHEKIYQIACLMGKNHYDKFQFKLDTKQKLKAFFIKNIKNSLTEQKDSVLNNTSSQINNSSNVLGLKTHKGQLTNLYYKPNQAEQTHLLTQKIDEQFQQLTIERFYSSSHFIFTADPSDPKTRFFLQLYPSITKKLHFSWYEHQQLIKNQTLYKVSQHLLTQQFIQNEQIQDQNEKLSLKQIDNIIKKCQLIFNQEKDTNFNNHFVLSNNVGCQFLDKRNKIIQEIKNKMSSLEKKLQSVKNLEKSNKLIEQTHAKVQTLKQNQKQLSKQLQKYTSKLSQIQMGGISQTKEGQEQQQTYKQEQSSQIKKKFDQIQSQLRRIKIQKQAFDNSIKQARRALSIYNQVIKMLPSQQCLKQKINLLKQNQKDLLNRIVLTWSTLVYLGHQKLDVCVNKFRKWQSLLNQNKTDSFKLAQNISDILKVLQSVIPYHQCKHIYGLQRFSPEIIFKSTILLYNLSLSQSSIYSQKLLRVYDPQHILNKVLRSLHQNFSYGEMRLLNQYNGIGSMTSINGQIEKELLKNRAGLILVYQQINKNTHPISSSNQTNQSVKVINGINIQSNHNLISYKDKNMYLYDDLHKLLNRKIQQQVVSNKQATSNFNLPQNEKIILERINRVLISTNYYDSQIIDLRIQTQGVKYPTKCLELTSISFNQSERITQLKAIKRQIFKDSIKIQQFESQFYQIFGNGKKLSLLSDNQNKQNQSLTKNRNDIIQQGIQQIKKIIKNIQLLKNNLQKNNQELLHQRFFVYEKQDLIQLLTQVYSQLNNQKICSNKSYKQLLDLRLMKQIYKELRGQQKQCLQYQKDKQNRYQQRLIIQKQHSQSSQHSNQNQDKYSNSKNNLGSQNNHTIALQEKQIINGEDLQANQYRLNFLKSVFVHLRVNILGILSNEHTIVKNLKQSCIQAYIKRVFNHQQLSQNQRVIIEKYLNQIFDQQIPKSLVQTLRFSKLWGGKIPILIIPNSIASIQLINKFGKNQIKTFNLLSLHSLNQLNTDQNEFIDTQGLINTITIPSTMNQKIDQIQQYSKLKTLHLPQNIYSKLKEDKTINIPSWSSLKIFTNYDDKLHFEMISDIVEKYSNQFKDDEFSRSTYIILIVNDLNSKFIQKSKLVQNLALGNLPGNQYSSTNSCCGVIFPSLISNIQNMSNKQDSQNYIKQLEKILEQQKLLFIKEQCSNKNDTIEQPKQDKQRQIFDQKQYNFLNIVKDYILIKSILTQQKNQRERILNKTPINKNLNSFKNLKKQMSQIMKVVNKKQLKKQVVNLFSMIHSLAYQGNSLLKSGEDLISFLSDYENNESIAYDLIVRLVHDNLFVESSDSVNKKPQFKTESILEYLIKVNQQLLNPVQRQQIQNDILDENQLKFDIFEEYQKIGTITNFQKQINQEQIQYIIEQLPFAFNFGQMIHTPSLGQDPFSLYILERCYCLNKRLKSIKKHIRHSLKQIKGQQYSLSLLPLKLPTQEYIQALNKQHILLKKILTGLGLIESVNGSVSTNLKNNSSGIKGKQIITFDTNVNGFVRNNQRQQTFNTNSFQAGPFPTSSILSNSLNLQNIGFTDQLSKIWSLRIAKKIKTPLEKVTMNWIIHPQQFEEQIYTNYQQQSNANKIIPNISNYSQLFLIINGTLINGHHLVIGPEYQKNNQDIQNKQQNKSKKKITVNCEKQKFTSSQIAKNIKLVFYPSVTQSQQQASLNRGTANATKKTVINNKNISTQRKDVKKATLLIIPKLSKTKTMIRNKGPLKSLNKKESEQNLVASTIKVPIKDSTNNKIIGYVDTPLRNQISQSSEFINLIDAPYFLV